MAKALFIIVNLLCRYSCSFLSADQFNRMLNRKNANATTTTKNRIKMKKHNSRKSNELVNAAKYWALIVNDENIFALAVCWTNAFTAVQYSAYIEDLDCFSLFHSRLFKWNMQIIIYLFLHSNCVDCRYMCKVWLLFACVCLVINLNTSLSQWIIYG